MDPHQIACEFDNAESSDLLLELAVAPGVGSKRATSSESRSFHCHKFVLGCGSPALRQRLFNWEKNPASEEQQPDLVIEVASAEVAQAVEDMVKFLYTKSLPADASPVQLLQLLITSDEYQSEACMEACARHLEGLEDSSFSAELLLAVFQLPPFLLEQTSKFRGVVLRAKRKLEDTFLDLEAAWQKEELRELFLKLPALAVKVLLQLDTLAVVSENTVLLALLCWLEVQPQEALKAVKAELIMFIRLQHLSPAYLHHILPHMPCDANPGFQLYMRGAQALMGYSEDQRLVVLGPDGFVIPANSPLCLPPRSGTTSAVRSCRLTVSLAQVQRMRAAAKGAPSDGTDEFQHDLPILLLNGFQLSPYLQHIKLDSSPGAADKPVTLGFYVDVAIFSVAALSPDLAVLLVATYTAVKEGSPKSNQLYTHLPVHSHVGYTDFFGLLEDPPNTLASFAQDGQVTVEYEVHSCV